MTRYTYDTQTFRLLRQRSEKYIRTHLNGMITYAYDSGTNKQDYHYQYDLVGNILKITDKSPEAGVGGSASLERNFDYDPLYRLLKATGRENAPLEPMPWDDAYRSQDKTLTTAYTQNYTYDKMGNILKLQHLGNINFTRNFSYNANSNKLDELQFGSTTLNYNYDPCGNLLNEDASRHNEWDYADRMRCFRIQTPNNEPSKYAQYLYDAGGNRVMKLVRNQGGTWSSIIYIDGIFEFLQNSDEEEQSNTFIMDDISRIAIVRAGDAMGDGSPAVKYNLEDSLGSSMTLLSTDGSWINWEEYYPFGETSLGSYEKKRYRYVGKEHDEESGLYYYGARYYAAWTCRFISVDPLAGDYNQLTPYQNAGNNPINDFDIDGMQGANTPEGGDSNTEPQTSSTNSSAQHGIFITGDAAEAAVEQLRTATNLTVNRDPDTGRISFEGEAKNKKDRLLLRIQDDKNVKVNINAVKGVGTVPFNGMDIPLRGGAYLGTEYQQKSETFLINNKPFETLSLDVSSVETFQTVNPSVLGAFDSHVGMKGQHILYEIAQSYFAGVLSLYAGESDGPTAGIQYQSGYTEYFSKSKFYVDARKKAADHGAGQYISFNGLNLKGNDLMPEKTINFETGETNIK